MSQCKINVCRLILREQFGDVTEQVGSFLMKKPGSLLKQTAAETGLKMDQVRKALSALAQQNIVTFAINKRDFTEYSVNTEVLLWRRRFPRYIYCAKTLYGDAAELLVEDILHQGQSSMSRLVNNVSDKLNEALVSTGHAKISASLVYEKFCSLAKTHFIQHAHNPLESVAEDEDERELSEQFTVPPMDTGETRSKRKRSIDDTEPPSKKQKTSDDHKSPDDDLYWKVNNSRFHQYFRDQMFITAIHSKLDKRASQILQTMLRLSEVKTYDIAFTTNPLSFTEIQQAVLRDHSITKNVCEQYLSILAEDSCNFITRVGDSGGGMFSIDIYKALTTLCTANIESVVQERFGSKSLRIFRVLLIKKHLEQKQIEEMAMIPAKEAKELLYTMFAQNFISLTEISKTPDHAPARTYYLFRVDRVQLARMLLEHSYKALANAIIKREAELKEHRRLMEKQERVDAIVASLTESGADQEQKDEIQQTITPAERTQLEKVKHTINMLEQSELQMDDTIITLETFLYYSDEKLRLRL